MKVTLMAVPPGGGETGFEMEVEMPAVPNPQDYINLNRTNKNEVGVSHFIVRRTWWNIEHDGKNGRTSAVAVEVEFASGPTPSEAHKKSIEMYEGKGKSAKKFENTAY